MDIKKQEQGAKNRLIGKWGETLVAKDLRRKGWRIFASGYRCRFGEIDLIASKGDFLCFIEVKLRKGTSYGTASEAVTVRKQSRIRATAALYLARYPTNLQPRFDVAEIYAPQGLDTVTPQINYIENAF